MTPEENDRIELEPSRDARAVSSGEDRRRRIEEPLPVRLLAVRDVRLPAPAGVERELDALYAGVLRCEREPGAAVVYRSENFRLNFELVEGLVVREDYRPLGVEVDSLAEVEHRLIEAEMEYERQRGLTAGWEGLLLIDPAGNWVEIIERREVR